MTAGFALGRPGHHDERGSGGGAAQALDGCAVFLRKPFSHTRAARDHGSIPYRSPRITAGLGSELADRKVWFILYR